MRRREFITLLGGAAAWPLEVRAQQAERMRRIGVLLPASADDSQFPTWIGAFLQALALSGWIIGRNVRIDTRWAGANADAIRRHAVELAALAPDVILAHGNAAVGALLQATRTVPIVFPVSGDPVATGFVDSLARPGSNVTGFSQFEFSLSGKWPELLKQITPGVTRAAVLRDPALGTGTSQFAVIQAAANSLGMNVNPVNMRSADEIVNAIENFARTVEWRFDCHGRWGGATSSRFDHRVSRQIQASRDLLRKILCRRWRVGFLRCQPNRPVSACGQLC
jgi:putative tryptophan/tyrosine transport system substrate-binding protein